MALDPISMAMMGGGIIGGILDAKSQSKARKAAEAQRRQAIEYLNKMHGRTENQGIDIYQQLANQGQQYQQAAMDTQYNMLGPQMNLLQDGNVGAQNYLQQALGGMNSATLGGALPQFSAPMRLDTQSYMPMAQQSAMPNLLALNYGGLRG
jgi:hypothetical protein